MAIITVTTVHTHSSLMRKPKSDLVDLLLMYMDAQDDIRRAAFDAGYSWRTPAFESEIQAAYAEYVEQLQSTP